MVLGLSQLSNAAQTLSNCGCGIGNVVQKLNPCDDDTTQNADNSENVQPSFFQSMGQNGKFGPKMTKYENFQWAKLPSKARNAALALGFNQETWDGGWSELSEYWWEDLSASQKEAATTLGWDQPAWDSKYNDTDWCDLPPNAKNAAKFLGFTQYTWDEGEWPAIGEKWWESMTEDERNALYVLGYNEDSWE